MSSELKKVRRELEATKAALQAQAARCRQLLAAFSRKLQEKEKELRASHDLRDRQLACVLRSLLTLEARLRKEQKLIRQQLVEKDRVIAQQNRELAQWRRTSPDLSGEARLDSLCRRSDSVETIEYGYVRDSPLHENAYRDNPVLESVQQILLKDEEDLLTVKPVDTGDKQNVEVGVAWYETDSSLPPSHSPHPLKHPDENTLPWGDQEDKVVHVPERNPSAAWRSDSSPHHRETQPSGAWCIKVIEAGEPPPSSGHERLWVKDKVSPPTKAQHLEEKACLQMAKKNLTIAVQKDLEEIEANSLAALESSYQELSPVSSKPAYQKLPPQKPPALPPKPSRLLKPSEILKRSEALKVITKPDTHPKPRVHVQEMKRKQMNGHVPGNVKPQAPFVADSKTETDEPRSVSALKPIPDTTVIEVHQTNPLHDSNLVQRQSVEVLTNVRQIDDLPPGRTNPPNGLRPSSQSPVKPKHSRQEPSHGSSQSPRKECPAEPPRKLSFQDAPRPELHQESPDALRNSSRLEPAEAPIRICSSVSSLITGATRESIVTELSSLGTPSSESLSSETPDPEAEVLLQENFEEFKLEECYVESVNEGDGRPQADGAEARCVVSHYAVLVPPVPPSAPPPLQDTASARTYETFLETTGLSQKSILTPSRMLSNHRSCLKPKDVKHRSRVKAAAVGAVPTVKYWTEPYL